MKLRITLSAITAVVPVLALGQTSERYDCSNGELTRRVEIVYETGVAVPCEVHYYKDTEAPGERQVLWRAVNQSGYCESQTEAFVEQLRGWGWSCVGAAATPPADDTGALGAGTP